MCIFHSEKSYYENTICECQMPSPSLLLRGHGGAVVSSEVGGSNPGPNVGKLVVAYQCSAISSKHNLDQLYVLVSSVHKTICRDMTCTVLKVT